LEPDGDEDPLIKAIEHELFSPQASCSPDFVKCAMNGEGTFPPLGASVASAGEAEVERRVRQRRKAGAPPPQCYGSSRRLPPPKLRQVPLWELRFKVGGRSETLYSRSGKEMGVVHGSDQREGHQSPCDEEHGIHFVSPMEEIPTARQEEQILQKGKEMMTDGRKSSELDQHNREGRQKGAVGDD
jgi:hypothetical protein